jgi:hypothetical protein
MTRGLLVGPFVLACGPLVPTPDAGTSNDAAAADVACVGDYQVCTGGGPCCTTVYACNLSTTLCQPACVGVGELCNGDGDCCSGLCNGTCQ